MGKKNRSLGLVRQNDNAPPPLALVAQAAPGLPGMDEWKARQEVAKKQKAEADLLRRELESLR